ncbi:MAG TPA: GMC oxidoreductase [Flexivirga sp.]|uniref:GMC oxidoreductase n=1 Tax=Flexivirga sp. TaxID=1962927 RepID=UPI002BAC3ACA|nr:GMC oxidoreductase [Flexivirga sp.]HWC23901.1 GMC oxidoreductase [Flexivirga sp.]
MAIETDRCHVAIVGSGIMGAAVAQLIREASPEAYIVMLEAGRALGPTPGQHLHDVPEGDLRSAYRARVASGVQGLYVGAGAADDLGAELAKTAPGMYHLSTFGEDSAAMPTAALAWNTGGMGVHWTAATPAAWGQEVPDFIDASEWAADMDRAQSVLRVNPDPVGPSALRTALLGALNEIFAPVAASGREVQPLPMAVNPDANGGLVRTGPNLMFLPISEGGDPRFELRSGCLVTRILHDGGRVSGVRLRDVQTGAVSDLGSDVTVVCADVFRTPQLLFASDIKPDALGCYLNEHAFLTGRASVALDRIGIEPALLAQERSGEWSHTSFWLPHSDAAQPFNGQLSGTVRFSPEGEPVDSFAGLAMYVPTETRRANRVEFSATELDAAGMPRMRIRFERSERDLELVELARSYQQRAGARIGHLDPATDSVLLPPGTSLHMTGTSRMGPTDDGTSVCDPDSRVWGFDNLFLSGCGVVPTALVGNSTLTGVVTAVRAARAAAQQLNS